MEMRLRLPVGIDSFEKLRKGNYYYVDKTQLIEQVLNRRNKVSLFTRPRRFGKTLNMSMLKNFFEIGADSTLFDGLYISQNEKMCEEYMGKYPVIFLSLKITPALRTMPLLPYLPTSRTNDSDADYLAGSSNLCNGRM